MSAVEKEAVSLSGADVDGAAVTANPVLIGAEYKSVDPTYANGQMASLRVDVNGHLLTSDPNSAAIVTDLAQLHTDNVAIEGKLDTANTNLGTLHTDLGTVHTDLDTTIHADLTTGNTNTAQLHTDNVAIETKLDTLHADLGTVETNQGTGNTSLANIDTAQGAKADAAATTDTGAFSLIALIKRLLGKITAVDTGNVTVVSSALPTGASTAANQSTGNTSLASIATNTSQTPINTNGSHTTGSITSVTTLTAPANAVGFILQVADTAINNLRWRIGGTASASVGQQLQPGRDTGYIPCGANLSICPESANATEYEVQWITR